MTQDDSIARLEAQLERLRNAFDHRPRDPGAGELERLEHAAEYLTILAECRAVVAGLRLSEDVGRAQSRAAHELASTENDVLRAQLEAARGESGARITELEAELEALRSLDPLAAAEYYMARCEQARSELTLSLEFPANDPAASPEPFDERARLRREVEQAARAAMATALEHSRNRARRNLDAGEAQRRLAMRRFETLTPTAISAALERALEGCESCTSFVRRNANSELRILDPRTVELRPFPRSAMITVFGTTEGLVHECGARYALVRGDAGSSVGPPAGLAVRVVRGLRLEPSHS